MKNNIFAFSVICLFLVTIALSCSKLEREKDTIELETDSLLIDRKGGNAYIDVMANGIWEIQNVPDWISASPVSGDGYGTVTIEIAENKELERRKASLLFARGKASQTLEVEQLSLAPTDPFLELSQSAVFMMPVAGTKRIQLTANRPWKMDKNPYNWVSVSPSSGEGSAEITIEVKENNGLYVRNLHLSIFGEYIRDDLAIVQYGLSDFLPSLELPIFSFKQIEFNQGMYSVWIDNLFINPSIRNKIYLGNLVGHNTQSNANIPEFTGYTFNPITVSTSVPVAETTKTYIPSPAGQKEFARQIAENMSGQRGTLIDNREPFEYYTHKELQTIGVINLGVKLDELVSGVPFTDKEMTRKYGLIYSFKRTFFALDMDIPEKLIKEELKETDKVKGVSYVSTVSYGRVGLLIVESDIDSRNVKSVIDKVIASESLSQVESSLLSTVDICYVYFDENKKVHVQKGNLDVVNAYKEAIDAGTDHIYPVDFALANYPDNSPATISFTFKAGE